MYLGHTHQKSHLQHLASEAMSFNFTSCVCFLRLTLKLNLEATEDTHQRVSYENAKSEGFVLKVISETVHVQSALYICMEQKRPDNTDANNPESRERPGDAGRELHYDPRRRLTYRNNHQSMWSYQVKSQSNSIMHEQNYIS